MPVKILKSIPAILLYIGGLIYGAIYVSQNAEDLCKRIELCNTYFYTLRKSTEEEIQLWREIASTQYYEGNYELSKEILDIAILKSKNGSWGLYRDRAKASKRLNMYKDSIRDYEIVIELNPRRERSHLSLIESHICLKDYKGARDWIAEHIDKLRENDIKTFFKFFDLIAKMLLVEDYASSYRNYKSHIARNPIGYYYRERFWDFDRTKQCVMEASVSDKIKNDIMRAVELTEATE